MGGVGIYGYFIHFVSIRFAFQRPGLGYAYCGDLDFVRMVTPTRESRVVFLIRDAPLRDDFSFRNQSQEEYHSGELILTNLNIDMIKSFPLDYMHLICLGVIKKMLISWVKGPLIDRIGKSNCDDLSAYLEYLSKFITIDFARKNGF